MNETEPEDEFAKWIYEKSLRKKKTGNYQSRIISGDQLTWGTKKRKPMRKSSIKRSKEEGLYRKASLKHLKENPSCEICGRKDNLSIHHKSGRIGELLYDEGNLMTLCLIGYILDKKYPNSNHNHTGGCHGWVEANKSIARENGWIL
jgi:hypothetical protein